MNDRPLLTLFPMHIFWYKIQALTRSNKE